MSEPITYNIDDVIAAAVAVTRVNPTYVKESQDETVKPNKVLIRGVLANLHQITDEDRYKAQDVRRHWQGLSFTALSRTLNDFETSILDNVSKDTVFDKDNQAIGLISWLPYGYEKGRTKREFEEKIRMADNEPLGNIGSKIHAKITIIQVAGPYNYDGNPTNEKYLHTALTDKNQAVRFYHKQKLDGTNDILANIKQVRDDGITQLNYVKLL